MDVALRQALQPIAQLLSGLAASNAAIAQLLRGTLGNGEGIEAEANSKYMLFKTKADPNKARSNLGFLWDPSPGWRRSLEDARGWMALSG